MALRVWRGKPYPLGATWDGSGVNFAIFSENAEHVDLCLYDADGGNEQRIRLIEQTDLVWHCYLPDVAARPALRLPDARPLRPGARAIGSTRPSC